MSSGAGTTPEGSLADRFAALWQQGRVAPDLPAFLNSFPEADIEERLGVLLVDQRLRWGSGRVMPVEGYLRALPELADRPELVRQLRDAEARLRRETDERIAGPTEVEQSSTGPTKRAEGSLDPADTEWGESADRTDLGTLPPEDRREIGDSASFPTKTQHDDASKADFSLAPEIEMATAGEGAGVLLGTDRYTIQSRVGAGGMGVVYRAYDRERGEVIAIKTMRQVDPRALYRFKQEFRTLADLSHRNLVNLFELVALDQRWFFTMELVEGTNFIAHVRSTAEVASEPEDHAPEDGAIPTEDRGGPGLLPPGVAPGPEGIGRLRRALLQLAEGVAALHDAGKLHRDIKPTNVLVTPQDRVVLLDFGLAADLGPSGHHDSAGEPIVGTVAFMAPEQGTTQPLSPACDWYSVGVILHVALTGNLPIEGRPRDVLARKLESEPPPPSARAGGVPDDLDILCRDLLRRDPAARPKGRAILARLALEGAEALSSSVRTPSAGYRPAAGSPMLPTPSTRNDPVPVSDPYLGPSGWTTSAASPGVPLIGRERHCDVLRAAYESVRHGKPETVFVSGRSGSGKSTLLQAFLEELAGRDPVVVLSGRCYERESVPYKALDSVVDALSRHLKMLPTAEVRSLLPPDVSLLARVFPVLLRVDALASAPRPEFDVPDQRELRRRAFAALRAMLARIGEVSPLVVAIDDLQWAEAENATLIADLLRPPHEPLMLLIGSFRSDDVSTSSFLRSLLGEDRRDASTRSFRFQELSVGSLSQGESRTLALALLGRDDPIMRAEAHLIARESHGNPFFLDELVKYVQGEGGLAHLPLRADAITLDEVLWARVGRLPEDARRLLGIVAASGRPIGANLALQAAGLGCEGRVAVGLLRSARLIRMTGPLQREAIEVYHDRIRETILARLPAHELEDRHRRLAETLEATGRAEPESLAVQFQGAGLFEEAAHYFVLAADRAIESLAFSHGARLYRRALDLRGRDWDPDETARLNLKLGDALANAGHGGEAAHAYIEAARGTSVAEALELRRRATMQLLISGRVDEGFASLRSMLAALGMALPFGPRIALICLVARRAHLRLRGYAFRRRDSTRIPAGTLTRIDLCWSAATGLSIIDPVCGAEFQARGLVLALRAGEPYRVSRALALEAIHVSTAGGRGRQQFARLMKLASDLSEEVDHPHTRGLIPLANATAALMFGRWREARESFDRAEAILRDRCTGVAWELDTVHNLTLWAASHMGDLAEIRRRCPVLIREARERGDLYAVTTLESYYMTIVRLAEDDPAGALRALEAVMGRWSHRGFHVQHLTSLRAHVQIDLYLGRGAAAWGRLLKHWQSYRRSQLQQLQILRIEMYELRGRSALAASVTAANPKPFLRSAERDARRLRREGEPWAAAFARLLLAGIAAGRGDRPLALACLSESVDQFTAVEMMLHATVAQHRLGTMLGGPAGQGFVSRAEAWMQAQGIRDPARMTSVYAPGFPDTSARAGASPTIPRG